MIYLISHGNYSDYMIDEVLEGPEPASLDIASMRVDFDTLKESDEFGDFRDRDHEKRWADLLVERYGFRRVAAHEMCVIDYSERKMVWSEGPRGSKPAINVAEIERTRPSRSIP